MTEARATEDESRSPLVSVVIPAFDAAGFLRRTVASVQAQSLNDLEILIIDDCSGDETLTLARTLAADDPRIRVIAAERNGGPAVARNLGLGAAKGEWIALLDADDAFEAERLGRLVGLARDCGADLLADNLWLEEEEGVTEAMLPLSEAASCAPITAADFLRGNLPDPKRPRKSYGFLKPLMSRAFLERHHLRYDESLRFAEDFAFYLACFAAGGRFFLSQEPLYRYRLRPDSLTACHSTADLRRLQAVDERFLRDCDAASPDFRVALRLHKKSIDQRLQWRVVIDALKGRAWHKAVLASLKGWHVFGYVSSQLIAEIWRRLWQKRLGSTPA
ncbi:glycosyltransferase family 2 protein [Pelagibius litoralis]|uniref:Glycosyltransferase family 2 protein n=1 Tax=Pelagibius litoralis TaxID=374515 RepID=A0A967C6U4_9PROT|nr:glycosyltransferase family 2 protein [Pelagibius litoralis]NIA67647.1 glycosyltransferase family 2 protein [Pelagibius litoralis]